WDQGSLTSPTYDSTLIGQNWHQGFMVCYLPRLTILSKAEFEDLGNDLQVEDVPIMVHDRFELGLSDVVNFPVSASSVLDSAPENQASNANDLDFDSHWISQTLSSRDQQEWLVIDLMETRKISGIKLTWTFLTHATAYEIFVSADSVVWNSVFATTTGNGLNDIIDQLKGVEGRYVKIAANRAALFNYGLNNVEIYLPQTSCLAQGATTSLSTEKEKGTSWIYPNPSQGSFSIKPIAGETITSVEVYTLNGARVATANIAPHQATVETDLAPGVYVLVLRGREKVYSERIWMR
ncbi:MAG: discoidin domain-containing protein, partial [Bacteroidota bacterium]